MHIFVGRMEDFINILKLLSNEIRLKIIWLLIKAKRSLCVCELVDALDQNQYNVSRHLKILKDAGLVEEKRDGRWVFYSLGSPKTPFQRLLFKAILTIPDRVFLLESERLKRRLKLRKDGRCVVGINSKEWRRISKELEDKLKKERGLCKNG